MGHEPSDTRDLLRDQEKPLIKAAKDLARAVEALEDADPDHLYGQAPRALIVGGYVRDLHLGLRPKDADIEVCGVAPDRLKELLERLFGKTKDVGESFGVIKVPIADGLELDVSIPRKESKAGKGHTGFLIDSDPSLNITEAARRRDFTFSGAFLIGSRRRSTCASKTFFLEVASGISRYRSQPTTYPAECVFEDFRLACVSRVRCLARTAGTFGVDLGCTGTTIQLDVLVSASSNSSVQIYQVVLG